MTLRNSRRSLRIEELSEREMELLLAAKVETDAPYNLADLSDQVADEKTAATDDDPACR